MDDAYITLEIDDDRCGLPQFELPFDVTAEETAYIQSLVPSTDRGFLQLVDPDTGEVVFNCTPVLVH